MRLGLICRVVLEIQNLTISFLTFDLGTFTPRHTMNRLYFLKQRENVTPTLVGPLVLKFFEKRAKIGLFSTIYLPLPIVLSGS